MMNTIQFMKKKKNNSNIKKKNIQRFHHILNMTKTIDFPSIFYLIFVLQNKLRSYIELYQAGVTNLFTNEYEIHIFLFKYITFCTNCILLSFTV